MNIIFWGLLSAMLLVAIVILILPLLRVRKDGAIAYSESNLQIHEDKLRELEQDLEEDRIDREHYKYARNELDRELLVDIPEEKIDNASLHYTKPHQRHPVIALVIALFVPLLALVVYFNLGVYIAGTGQLQAQLAQNAQQEKMSIPQMAQKLKQHIAKNGGNAQDWTMLGRAYKFMKQYADSDHAYAKAMALAPDNVEIMLERAEVIALLHGRKFVPEAVALIHKAATIQPNNSRVLWFAGVANYQSGDYKGTIKSLIQLTKTDTIKDKNIRKAIVAYITGARNKLLAQGETVPEENKVLAFINSQQLAVAAAVLQVHVAVSQKIRQQFNGNDTVFVYAKAQTGPPMPLAVQRLTLAQLPATVKLDDSMAMVRGRNISTSGKVVVFARISPSGSAIAQPGDYIGQIDVNDVHGNKAITITINKKVK